MFTTLGIALVAGGSLGLMGCLGPWLVAREEARTPRDAQTGVVTGAEAIDIPAAPGRERPGRAVLLMHGFVGSRGDYADLGERLAAEGFHVRMIRHAGHGTSPADFACQSPETMYAHVAEEFQALQARYPQVDVVGFSMGGSLGTMLAAEQPVHRLVLAAPYYGVTHKWYYGLRVEMWHRTLGWSLNYVPKTAHFVKCNNPATRGQIYSYGNVPLRGVTTLLAIGAASRAPEVVEKVSCPVQMLISDGDEASCPIAARRIFGQLKAADKRFVEIDKRNNHHIFWDLDAEPTKQAIIDFLSEPDAGVEL